MESDPLQKAHNRLLKLQNALEVSGGGFWQIDSQDRIEIDAVAGGLLGLDSPCRPEDLSDFLMHIDESQHGTFLNSLDAVRSENKELKIHLRLKKTEPGRPTGFRLSARLCQPPGELAPCICGLIQTLPESPADASTTSESALAQVRSANAELANFASIASHDMREPLRMITSYLRLLKERSPEALDQRARRYIDYACEGADRMRNLIEDLLSYARLDKSGEAPGPLALEDVLSVAIDNLNTNIRDTRADVTVEIDNAPVIVGDNIRLARLFQNLIANAIKFNEPDVAPRIHISFQDGDISGASGKWIVRIKDDGIGIHPDHHDMLFNLFQRLNTRDEFEGSGIGLAVCKKIAEQHGGRIWFDSVYGEGSTFYVALNKADPLSLA